MDKGMTKKISGQISKTAIAAGAAIGSAAIAAALLYVTKRKDKNEPDQLPAIPSGEPPETD